MQAIRYWWQRRTRGFDDSVAWQLNAELAKWLLPRLKRFRELNNGYPPSITPEMWDEILKKIIIALEIEANDDLQHELFFAWINGPDHMEKHWKKLYRKRQEGLYYLGKFFEHLWW